MTQATGQQRVRLFARRRLPVTDITLLLLGAMIVFGVVGYLMKKFGFEPGPMVLAFVLGSIVEASVRRSMLMFDGDPTGFFTRPISGTLLVVFIVVALWPAVKLLRDRKGSGGSSSPR